MGAGLRKGGEFDGFAVVGRPERISHHKRKEEDLGWLEIQVLHADSAGERT
jgi:hypothetical protein